MGLGTEQVEKSISRIFPKAKIARLDRSIVKTRRELEAVLNSIALSQVDLIIGTQMIAKGHDFPGIALVGILMADASLNLPDFRAHEKTFQIITQVSGRAGRGTKPGEVIIQTLNPAHPVLLAAAEHRAVDFYRSELQARREFGFPPYQRLAMLRFQHPNQKTIELFSQEIVEFACREMKRKKLSCSILGPSEAPLGRLKNLYRWQSLIKSESVKDLQWLL
jgi:primosomal protein N' (replication factor Y)